MPNVWTFLPFLACPLGMGFMIWLMLRSNQAGTARQPAGPAPSPATIRRGALCVNPRVLAGLALVGLSIWVAVPQFVGAAVPILLVAACPLSMLWMMRGDPQATPGAPGARVGAGRSRADHLANLQAQLARTQAEQAAITRAIAQVAADQVPGATSPPGVPAAGSAAPVRFADERVQAQT